MEEMPKSWDRGTSLDLAVLIEDAAAAPLEVAALTVLLKKKGLCMYVLPRLL